MLLTITIELDEKGLRMEGRAKHTSGESIVTHSTSAEEIAAYRYTKHTVAAKVGYLVQDLMDETHDKLK